MSDSDSFDYVVSGAGSAGCAVAARLSESGRHRVLLLEAGPRDTNPWIHVPLGYSRVFLDPKVNWRYESEPEEKLNGRQLYLPRGKVLGGTSAINGMIYIRGTPADYDGWRQQGCTGWDWESVLPFYKKMEHQARGPDDFHGTGGPVRVSDPPRPRLVEPFLEACREAGLAWNPDFNGATQEGYGLFQTTTADGRRWSAATAYLKPARNRRNLLVRTGAHSCRVVFEGRRATGVEYQMGDERRVARATREVIVCGGAYGSPQLLMLSGLGPAQHLTDLGIPVLHDLPGVGANLHDHFCAYSSWRSSGPGSLNDLRNSPLRQAWAGMRYVLGRRGLLAYTGNSGGVFARSDPRLENPDLQIVWLSFSVAERSKTATIPHPSPAFSMLPVHLQPDARGSVRLRSPDPFADPAIRFDFMRTDYDVGAMVAGMRLCRRIAAQPALRGTVVHEVVPGEAAQTDEELVAFLRRAGTSNSHPTSSCAMGIGPQAVVDPRLRVHGVQGLRVADASIMPSVIHGNTNAPAIMIGEKAAAMVLEDA
jgi:choline dehydrogenase